MEGVTVGSIVDVGVAVGWAVGVGVGGTCVGAIIVTVTLLGALPWTVTPLGTTICGSMSYVPGPLLPTFSIARTSVGFRP